ncbi:hypothetical protein Tco_0782378 [Tanacetum coccineum]
MPVEVDVGGGLLLFARSWVASGVLWDRLCFSSYCYCSWDSHHVCDSLCKDISVRPERLVTLIGFCLAVVVPSMAICSVPDTGSLGLYWERTVLTPWAYRIL